MLPTRKPPIIGPTDIDGLPKRCLRPISPTRQLHPPTFALPH